MKWDREEIARFLGIVGASMLVAGYLRYSIQAEMLRLSQIILIAGGVLVLASLVLGFQGLLKFFSKRSSRLGTNTAILALAVLAILAVLNFLGYRHHKRFDLTTEKLFTLSDQTDKIVRSLQKDVNIIRFDKAPDRSFDDLMTEYRNLSPRLKFQNVDPQQKPEVAHEYGVTHMGDVVVASGSRTEHLNASAGGNPSESDIVSAILKVTRDTQKTVCFVTGHGEKSPTDGQAEGYSLADTELKKENYLTKTINLVSDNGVPSDCTEVVIAGPTQAYFPQETAFLTKYLDDGGKALIEVDPDKDLKLENVFQAWNISVGNNFVIDASGMGQLLGTGPAIPLVVDYGASPITKSLERHMTFFPLARTVAVADKAKSDPQTVELLKTSSRSFTKPKLEHEVRFDPKTDMAGPLSLGVAASRTGEKSARLVVIGDSDFASNQAISQSGSNGDLFFNTINWLAEDENLISIRPKSAANRQVTLTESQRAGLTWLDLLFLPGLIVISGIYIWWKRR